jgi:DnaJ-class molecular chaperone
MTAEQPDLYAILGVRPDATQAGIGHAYRSLLRRYHPDMRAPVDESQRSVSDAALRHVVAAYAVLRDPARRADYDRKLRPRTQQVPRRPREARNHDVASEQPPIVAGPVRWHRSP